ncbi:serine/threonine-protein kinase [Streptomyces sp. SID5770]|uniref:serine/threonine-protein kinase n=1 Tax=Streptomyces sp. SID5770 TaxID=2690308 RepID=UPI001F021B3C|nr:serine/threonine-protein kinase [Streptomyces sp. SID5770]
MSGRYRLDGLLGSGGAADVHRGFDLRLRRPVAVKVFRAGADCGTGEGLHGEAVVLARLHHPGLVAAYDAGQHDGHAFLVMQLVEGGTLKARIAQGPLSLEETASIGAGLARALAHAHGAGIVHRDVKPSNILLDTDRRPHLADFGISRLLDATARTATGALVGTAAYLSPEQVLGRPVGRPADVYALGLVLVECLTGRLEYDGVPLESAIARLHRSPVLPHWLPERFSALLGDMTALDEESRPTALDCARTLAALIGGAHGTDGPVSNAAVLLPGRGSSPKAEDTHAHPSSSGERAASPGTSTRGRALAAGTAVALAAVAVTTLAVTGGPGPRGDDRGATGTTGAPAEDPGPSTPPVPRGSTATSRAAPPSTASEAGPEVPAGPLSGPGPTYRPTAAASRAPDRAGPPHRPPGQAGKPAGPKHKGLRQKAPKAR